MKDKTLLTTTKKTPATGANAIPTTGHQWNFTKGTNATKELKPREPWIFRGDNKQVDIFLQEVENYMVAQTTSTKRKMALTLYYMNRANTRNWANCIHKWIKKKDNDPTIWETFKMMFKEEYGRTHKQILNEITHLTMKNLPTEQYATEFKILATKAKLNKMNLKLARIFLMGLKEWIKLRLLKAHQANLYPMIMKAACHIACNINITNAIMRQLMTQSQANMATPTEAQCTTCYADLTRAIVRKASTQSQGHTPVTIISEVSNLASGRNKVLQ
jgi:hypothetical protein